MLFPCSLGRLVKGFEYLPTILRLEPSCGINQIVRVRPWRLYVHVCVQTHILSPDARYGTLESYFRDICCATEENKELQGDKVVVKYERKHVK